MSALNLTTPAYRHFGSNIKSNMAVLLSGGFSSQLEKYVDEREIAGSPLWCSQYLASNPDVIIRTHEDYIKGRNVLVAGSVGPYGACLCDGSEYTGNYMENVTAAELKKWHRPRILALVEAGVDILAVETIPALGEAVAVLELLKDEFPNTKVWISFTCKDEKYLSHGELFSEAVAQCSQVNRAQLVAIGVNCIAPALVSPLLKTVQGHDIPFIVYPNSGEIWKPGVGYTNKEACLPLVQFVSEWISLGAKYVGGCCRTTAEDIKQLRDYLDSHYLHNVSHGYKIS